MKQNNFKQQFSFLLSSHICILHLVQKLNEYYIQLGNPIKPGSCHFSLWRIQRYSTTTDLAPMSWALFSLNGQTLVALSQNT